MTPEQLSAVVRDALASAVDAGEVALPDGVPDQVRVERPRQKTHGDYATNAALQLARRAGVSPRALAEILASRLRETPGIAAVDIAGPGFLNLTVAAAAQGEIARTVVRDGKSYGRSETLSKRRINLEFISANPTGPLHLGHVRWAAVGDALGRVLEAAGAEVSREFYINDRGVQMDLFGASLMAVVHGRPVPDNGYRGQYVVDLGRAIATDHPEFLALPEDQQLAAFREEGYRRQLTEQRQQLHAFGTDIDVWSSERSLHDEGHVEHALARLRKQGHVYEADGALWMRTTDFGDDKDRVLVRSDGAPSYFASDTAYYVDKRERGFDGCLYLLGADHHGYVGRLRAMAACAGDDPAQNIEILVGQLVKILKDGAEMRLSKRAGTIVTIQEVVEETGVDALRYTLIRYPADTPLTLDVDAITRQANDNPVFYVQYAHARLSSILRNAAEVGADRGQLRPELLAHEREGDLLRSLGEFPRVVATAAELREPHRVPRYLEELAATFHRFYDVCRVLPLGDEELSALHQARLWLVEATRVVLANGLGLLGVTAPERM